MRHLKSGRKLGRTASHRKATMSALSVALIKNEQITTTLAKAKELRTFIEPLITRAKNDTNFNRARVFRFIRDKDAITKLFDEIGPMVADRPGGYTRVIKIGPRSGDGAEMALIELVDYNDVPPETGAKKKKTRRGGRRRGGGKGKAAQATATKQQPSEKSSESSEKAEKEQQAAKEKAEKPTSAEADQADTKAKEAGSESEASEKQTKGKAETAKSKSSSSEEKSTDKKDEADSATDENNKDDK